MELRGWALGFTWAVVLAIAAPGRVGAVPTAASPPRQPLSSEQPPTPGALPPIPVPPEPPATAGKPPPKADAPPAPPEPPSLSLQAAIRHTLAVSHENRQQAAALPPTPGATTPAAEIPAAGIAKNPADDAEQKPPRPAHGDLVDVGMIRLISAFSYASVALGPTIIGNSAYVTADPQLALYSDNWSVAAHVPLNLNVVNLEGLRLRYGGMKIRRDDWLQPADFLRVIRFVTVGHREDPFFASLSSLQSLSLGHRMLIDRYQGNLDVNRLNTSLLLDLSNHIAGLQGMVNDVTLGKRLVGGVGFVKPFFWADQKIVQSLSLGVEYAADFDAPRCVRLGVLSATCVRGTGNVGGVNPINRVPLDATYVRSDAQTGLFAVHTAKVEAAGVSAELKVLQNSQGDNLKAYSTWHRFLNQGGGTGWVLGALGRFQTGGPWIHAFRGRGEYRTFTDGFLPSYFGTTYEADKYEFGYNNQAYQVTPTKYQAVFGDPQNGFAKQQLGRRHGFKFDLQWALYRGRRQAKQLAVGFGIEDSSGPNDSAMYAHVEVPAFHALQVFGTYLHRNEANFAGLFQAKNFRTANTVLLAGLRLRVLPILWLSVQYAYSFARGQSPGTEYHLGNAQVVGNNAALPAAAQTPLFRPASTLAAQLEFGWDFGD